MSKLVRCELPDGIHRFNTFTVADYRDFLMIRNDLDNNDVDTKILLIDELLEEYFPDIPKSWRPYVFVSVFCTSIGKNKIPLVYTCSCGKTNTMMLNLEQKPLKHPSIEIKGVTIKFKIPDHMDNTIEELILNNLYSVEQNGVEYYWSDLIEYQKSSVFSLIEYSHFETIIEQMNPIFFRLRVGCSCNKERKDIIYQSILPLFETIIHPDEIYTFYQIIHTLNKANYSISEVLKMIPIERSIILSLIEKDKKK